MTHPRSFSVGAVFPTYELGSDPIVIRDFAQAIEDLGYGHLIAYDQVIGANHRHRPGWKDSPHDHASTFQEPLVLFSYLSAVTHSLEFLTSVIVLPQRQTVLLAKQAACLDNFCQGRLRLGVGAGMNSVCYEALGVPMETRGRRLDEQIEVMRKLWAEPSITVNQAFHTITDAGISPLPLKKEIPLWVGGNSASAMKRAARLSDGWLPHFPAETTDEKIGEFRELVKAYGRDPDIVGFENSVLLGRVVNGPPRTADDAIQDTLICEKAGSSGVSIRTLDMGLTGPDQHIALFKAIAAGLGLKKPA